MRIRTNAHRLKACWNALTGVSPENVERLGKMLERYNNDELAAMLADEEV